MALIRKAVKSSFIKAVEYDLNTRRMLVLFQDGKAAAYNDVTETLFTEFTSAKSVGRFYTERIKTGGKARVSEMEAKVMLDVMDLFREGLA